MQKRYGLLGVNSDAKTKRGLPTGHVTGILYLSPANEIAIKSVCSYSTEGCRQACLYKAGRGAMSNVITARQDKTRRFVDDRGQFMADLCRDVSRFRVAAVRSELKPVIRLNGTSDIMWENIPVKWAGEQYPNIMRAFPYVQWYDYTKIPIKFRRDLPPNYDLTFSRSEDNEHACFEAYKLGVRVAVVWRDRIPKRYHGRKVVDGTANDLRFLDKAPIVGLCAKGTSAKLDMSGFVLD